MKTLSFGCDPTDKIYMEQVLPALLNKTKVQTIRPAWRIIRIENKRDELNFEYKKIYYAEKEPRFKIGEGVKFYWKQRSRYNWFCSCGNSKNGLMNSCLQARNRNHIIFDKVLGTGIVTELFKVEMTRTYIDKKTEYLSYDNFEKIAKLDGFNSADDMFAEFDSWYNLVTPKSFYIIRWKWD